MIDLTPLEVRKKKGDFKRVLRGYDGDLVDDFLDLVADRLEELVRENLGLTERVTRLEELVTDHKEREKALTEALVSAHELKEARLNQASREADLRVREAQTDAERIRDDALREREREEEALRRVRARRTQLIDSFRAFLQREMHQLDVESAALDLQDVTAEAAARVWELGDETRRPLGSSPTRQTPPAVGARPAPARLPAAGQPPTGPRAPAPPPGPYAPPVEGPHAPPADSPYAPPVPPAAGGPASPPPFTAFSTQLNPTGPAEPPESGILPGAPSDDGLPPITGDEDWLPQLEDER